MNFATYRDRFGEIAEQSRHWLSRHRRALQRCTALALLFLFMGTALWLVSTYSYYAAVIDRRLASHALQIPAGIYAAPRRISTGERLTRAELLERLQRAGFHEGTQPYEYAPGSFLVQDNAVEIIINDFHLQAAGEANGQANGQESMIARARVHFRDHSVARIEDVATKRAVKTVRLPAQLLTADLQTIAQTTSATRFDELPKVLIDALCAIEDRNFFSHDGIDARAITRAFFKNLTSAGIREGGSTITQQLIKNQFLSAERTYGRKLAEAMMALALERRLSKEQIFALYCDRVYLGQSGLTAIYGFKQAARLFFGKELGELTVSEAALLAGIVKAPNRYSPHDDRDEALARRDVVLAAMLETGAISEAAAEAARHEQLALLPPQRLDNTAAPHFVDYVKRQMERRRLYQEDAETAAHLRVETTLDLDLQEVANRVVSEQLGRLDKIYRKRAAKPEVGLVALDPKTGEVLAMVGGRDYTSSQLNRVTDARRQPGSVFKPVIYAAAMANGVSPLTRFLNAPREIRYGYKAVYNPQNFGHTYSNTEVTLREAMVRSLNVVAVDAALRVGLGNVSEMAERMGLEQAHGYPSLALGTSEATPLDIASAYTTFANDGTRVEPLAIRAVRVSGEAATPTVAAKTRVLSPQMAYVVTETLTEVANRGTAARIRSLGYKGPAAGKTGTSRDAWFVGYTPNLLVVVWVGFDDNSDMAMTGGEAAVPIWTAFVKGALERRPELAAERFAKPAGLETVEIDPETGMLANEFCPQRQRVSLPGFLMPGVCFEHFEPLATDFPETELLDPATPMAEEDIGDLAPLPDAESMKIPVSAGLPKPPPATRRER